MKIVRFKADDGIHYGILEKDDQVIHCMQGSPWTNNTPAGRTYELGQVTLLAPVTPPNVLAIGLNYRRHAEESGKQLPDHPLLFIKATTAVTDPETPIVLPAEAPDNVDYEAELAIVIGRLAKRVQPDEALEYVLGYTCANDVSARDCQLTLDGQWARGKSFDSFCPLGPWIETKLSPNQCTVSSRLNGDLMQSSSTADMIFHCADLVSYLSRSLTLLPGTVILTGTPSGVGVARNPQVFLKPGDTIEVEISGIGKLRNSVAAEDPAMG